MALGSLLFGILALLPRFASPAGWAQRRSAGLARRRVAQDGAGAADRAHERPAGAGAPDARPIAGAIVLRSCATGARPLAYVPLIVLASLCYGVPFMTAFAMLADGAEEARLARGWASAS